MKNKTEICVPIRNEEELQQAKEILLRNGEKITKDGSFYLTNDEDDFLQISCFDSWWLGSNQYLTEIPLSELESILKGESVEKQSSIDWLVKELYRKFGENYELTNIVKQAKQMHREEILQAIKFGQENSHAVSTDYNEVKAKNYYTIKYTVK